MLRLESEMSTQSPYNRDDRIWRVGSDGFSYKTNGARVYVCVYRTMQNYTRHQQQQ